jgi:hypothetical protein
VNGQFAQEISESDDALAGVTYEILPLDLDSWKFVIIEARIEIQKHPDDKAHEKCDVMCFRGVMRRCC